MCFNNIAVDETGFMHSYGKDHIMWKAFSCFWKYMLCRKFKKNRFPINKLDWLFPCFGCMWLTRPQKYIALSDATFSKFLETVITYWATAPFPVWTEFPFFFFFLKAISVIGLYDCKAITPKQWIQVSLSFLHFFLYFLQSEDFSSAYCHCQWDFLTSKYLVIPLPSLNWY